VVWEVLTHLLNSSDLAPSDFHLFGYLKKSLGGIKFTNNDAVQSAFVNIGDAQISNPNLT